MSVLQGLKVLQVGPGLGAAVCGRLFADVGADVNCFKPGRVTPLAEHLNNGKLSLTALPESTDIVVLDGGPAALAENGWEVVAMRRRYPDAAIVALSPYGQTGPDADKPATDLTLFCASAIARCLTGQVDDLSEAPVRAVGEQSAFIGGLAAACAGMHAVLLGRSAFVDVSIQEALATLSMTELTKAGMGGSGWSRERLTDGNGATVCILPAKDGYAAISPREDHQWTAWLEAMGSPAWGDDPRFATKPDRVQNWDALHALMSEWSREIGKQDIADLAQKAHVPSFPLKEPAEHLESPQLASRAAFRTSKTAENSLKTIGDPFKIELFEGDPPPQRMPTPPSSEVHAGASADSYSKVHHMVSCRTG
ncbi:MAG: CoA transferase, partial [Pseudomonadota bacterium]|nr:CoA transferase [Pseudomonadota bacterium]